MVRQMKRTAVHWMHAVFIGWLAIPALAAPALQVDRTNVVAAQQDSAGVVWGIATYGRPGLYHWEENSWHPVASE